MSRGFVKEDDQEEAPFIPPRAALPNGATNYVTPNGLEQLHNERSGLEAERATVPGSDDERRRSRAVIDGKLNLLNERIVTARVVEPTSGAIEDVRFGGTVAFEHLVGPQKGKRFTFTLVGVDEADLKQGKIAFTAPISIALIGKRVGDMAEFALGDLKQQMRILSIK